MDGEGRRRGEIGLGFSAPERLWGEGMRGAQVRGEMLG